MLARILAALPARLAGETRALWVRKYTQVPSGCWAACVAGLTGLPHADLVALVPQHFAALLASDTDERELRRVWNAYHNGVNQYMREHGWRYSAIGPDIPRGFAIGVGKSPRGVDHAVIVKDGCLWWDPHPSRAGLVALTSFEVVRRISGQLP